MQAKGVRPATIQKVRFILSAIFTTALNDVTFIHPCRGVKTPTVPKKPLKIITPQQFDLLYRALPDAMPGCSSRPTSRAACDGETDRAARQGPRLGPAPHRQPRRREGRPKLHPSGGRFLVKEYPKDKEYRRLKLSAQIAAKIVAHIKDAGLGPDDLIFAMPPRTPRPGFGQCPPGDARLTEPNAAGRQYRHGTMSGYNAGGAGARTARTPPPCTGLSAGLRARTLRAERGPWTPTGTSPRLVPAGGVEACA